MKHDTSRSKIEPSDADDQGRDGEEAGEYDPSTSWKEAVNA
jgi:hypothetical protein